MSGQGELLFNFCGQPLVIIVEEGDPLGGGILHADVARVGASDAGLQGDEAQAVSGHGAGERASGVIRPVNHHDDFDGATALRAHAGDGALEQFGPIAGRDHRGNESFLHLVFTVIQRDGAFWNARAIAYHAGFGWVLVSKGSGRNGDWSLRGNL